MASYNTSVTLLGFPDTFQANTRMVQLLEKMLLSAPQLMVNTTSTITSTISFVVIY
jgi:hypothetical protein